MQTEHFDLQKHIEQGVEAIVADTLKATLKNPRESAFMAKFAVASRKASRTRMKLETEGLHVPGFLIASITSSCNLHCAGCYSRCSNATNDAPPVDQLSSEEWLRIFREAEELGVSFILLAGGEPMIRRDIVEAAGKMRNIIFPVFTNGTFIDQRYFKLLDECRNLIPVLSIEGGQEITDARRGSGIYKLVTENMDRFQEKGLIFGASITVTTENVREVSSPAFLDTLMDRGCKLVIFVEFVPVTEEARHLAPGEPERAYMAKAMETLRQTYNEAVLLSFPGDELAMGGCMAAGREFFHINSHGGAEPCPFSPYSDVNIRDTSLREAIASPLFQRLQAEGVLSGEHAGGCVLYEKRDQVEKILNDSANGSADS
ncbi:MAG: radical SAM protein [Oscillospiraceae bacterium]|nr:radical SAM protein [Oscillospiraceae bacterium]MBR7009291.1 radical SAM protein [Oscillospiraceae bacterium]